MSSLFLIPSENSERVIFAGSAPPRVPFHNFIKALIASGYSFTDINSGLKKNRSGQ